MNSNRIKLKLNPFTKSKQAQNWAIDVMIGSGIFVLGFILFFYIVDKHTVADPTSDMLGEADTLTTSLTSAKIDAGNPCAFVIDDKIDKTKLQQCARDYDQSKSLLGVKSDYCIYFIDQQGNLVNISSFTNKSGIGFGSLDINYTVLDVNGNPITVSPCSE